MLITMGAGDVVKIGEELLAFRKIKSFLSLYLAPCGKWSFPFFHRVFFCSESTQSVFSPNSYAHFYSQLFSCIFACFQSYPHCPQFYTHFYDPHNVDFLCITLFT